MPFVSLCSLVTWNFFFFSLNLELMITQQTTHSKLCSKDYVTTMCPAGGQFLLPENLLANPVKMQIMGVSLVRYLKLWGCLLIYCNNWLEKNIAPLLSLERGHSPFSSWCLCQVSLSLFTLIKLCYTNALAWSTLVPGPEAKSSTLEIMHPTLFTVSSQNFVHFHSSSGRL